MKKAHTVPRNRRNAAKKREKEFVERIMSIFRPKIVARGYTDMPIPEKIQTSILIERMILAKSGEKLATETETLWYLSTVSLCVPLNHYWYNIYMYLFRRYCLRNKMELPDLVKNQIVLEEYTEEQQLYKLRKWIYDKGMKWA